MSEVKTPKKTLRSKPLLKYKAQVLRGREAKVFVWEAAVATGFRLRV